MQFANYLNKNMEVQNYLVALAFTVYTEKHNNNIIKATQNMESNKAVGTDNLHVERLSLRK